MLRERGGLALQEGEETNKGDMPLNDTCGRSFCFSCDPTSEFPGEEEFVRRRIERKEVDTKNGALGYEKNEECSMRTIEGEAQGRRKGKIMLSCMLGH